MSTDRQYVANLIQNVLLENITVAHALLNFPKDSTDVNIECAFYALTHLEADEDLRKQDALYKDEQDDYLLKMAQILEKNEDLPQNIVAEYKKYYNHAPIYPKKSLKYIWHEIKKFINVK